MSTYRIVLLAIILFVTVSTTIVLTQFKNLSKAIPAKLEKELPVTPFEGWREFSSEQGDFSVKFPAIPQNAKDTVNNNNNENLLYDMYVAQKWDGAIFMVTVVSYPRNIESGDTNTFLKNFLTEMLSSNPNNELQSAQETKFLDYDALDFVIKNPQAHIDGKAFAKDNKIYFLSYVTDSNNRQLSDYTYFIDSFRLR